MNQRQAREPQRAGPRCFTPQGAAQRNPVAPTNARDRSEGPGIIRHIHTTRHQPADLLARGIVLEVYFDDAKEPAVHSPLADFFGDGCNGKSMDFTSNLIECAPWSYNCYFPMPFKTRAKVILRNDTGKNAMNYSYVEWEQLPEWKPDLGYFHATYRRNAFQLTKDTDEVLFHVKGAGHLLGRQFSIVTDEPLFGNFQFVVEGNNEVDIDGRQRALDYLGTEDSFTFSWGFRNTFAGLRAGMTLVAKGRTNLLSIYRFHDHMPIRFDNQLRWHINWKHERWFTRRPAWAKAVAGDGCWVDYATVYYWYQDAPGGYRHQPLRPPAERQKTLLHPAIAQADIEAALKKTKIDPNLINTFAGREDLGRVTMINNWRETHPFWIDRPRSEGGHPGNPNPGKQGILAMHPTDELRECYALRKVELPAGKDCLLRIVTSGDPYEAPGKSDFVLQAGIHDGAGLTWFKEEVVDAGTSPSEQNWRTLTYPLKGYAGKTVTIVVKVSCGGPKGPKLNEEAFFDEISVLTQ